MVSSIEDKTSTGQATGTNVPASLQQDKGTTFTGMAADDQGMNATGMGATPMDESRDAEGSALPLMSKVNVGFEVASDLFNEAKARLEEAAREFDDELKSKNPDSKMDAGWQVAEDAFNAARSMFMGAIDNLKSQLDSKGEDKSILGKTKDLAGTGVAVSKERLDAARAEFEKASAQLRERIKVKEEEKRMELAAENARREMQGAPKS